MAKDKIIQFQLNSEKKIKLHFRGPFCTRYHFPHIEIDEYFNLFSEDSKKAAIWHELFHRDKVGLKYIWWYFKYRDKARWHEEFEADLYAAKMVGKPATLKFLLKAKQFYERGIVEYDPKKHPPITERIKRIKIQGRG